MAEAGRQMSEYDLEANKAVVRRYVDVWNSGDLALLDEIVAADYVGYVATGDRNRAGRRDRIRAFRASLPDVVFTIGSQVGEGDLVTTRLTARGTLAQTGEARRLVGLNMSRIRDGQIVEEWAAWEIADV